MVFRMIPLPERIHQLVSTQNGIKASRLCAQMSSEYPSMTGKEIRQTLITMINSGEILEIEYIVEGHKNEALLLPVGARIMGMSVFQVK